MDASSIVSVIVAFFSVLGVYIANRYTAKSAQKAQETTVQLEMAKIEKERTEGWRADNIELRKQREEDKAGYETRMRHLNDRVESLEAEQVVSQRERKSIINWAYRVVEVLRDAGLAYPPPPPGLIDTDPNIPRVIG